MDAKEVAAAIAAHWDKEPAPLSPEEQHEARFLMAVCVEMGLEPNPVNTAHVASLMAKLHIAKHSGHEYPKALYAPDRYGRAIEVRYPLGHEKNGLPVVFHSAEEEAAYYRAAAPADHD